MGSKSGARKWVLREELDLDKWERMTIQLMIFVFGTLKLRLEALTKLAEKL